MSWRGFTKAVSRLPQRVLQKAGYAEETVDEQFLEIEALFKELENAAKQLVENTKSFQVAVRGVVNHQTQMGTAFQVLFAGFEESVSAYNQELADYVSVSGEWSNRQAALQAEQLDKIVVEPCAQLLQILEGARATLDKRNRKAIDYDRHLTNLNKVREKQGATTELVKAEQNFNEAKIQFDYYNNLVKEQVPILYGLRVGFMDCVMETLVRFQIGFFNDIVETMQPFSRAIDLADSNITETYKSKSEVAMEEFKQLNLIDIRLIDPTAAPADPAMAAAAATASSPTASTSPYPASTSPYPGAAPPLDSKPPSYRQSIAQAQAPVSPQMPAPANVTYAVALYAFQSDTPGDLTFDVGEKIEVTEKTDSQDDWWTGRIGGRTGIFPANYVQLS